MAIRIRKFIIWSLMGENKLNIDLTANNSWQVKKRLTAKSAKKPIKTKPTTIT